MNNVRLIVMHVNSILDEEEKWLNKVCPHYQERYRQVGPRTMKLQELLTGAMLYQYLDVKEDNQIIFGAHGKPDLRDGHKHFNISHTEDFVVLAIADAPVGVDIELPGRFNSAVAKRVFLKDQYEEIEKANNYDKVTLFAKYWTGYEAVIKYTGDGLISELDEEQYRMLYNRCQYIEFQDYTVCCLSEGDFSLTLTLGQLN